jgi:hypothetical protein
METGASWRFDAASIKFQLRLLTTLVHCAYFFIWCEDSHCVFFLMTVVLVLMTTARLSQRPRES